MTTTHYYVVEVFGGIEPKLHGAYKTEDEQQAAAKAIGAANDPDTDGVFWLDVNIINGEPVLEIGTGAYTPDPEGDFDLGGEA